VVLDESVNPAIGTGAVRVTPAHDPNDFEAGKRHNLPFLQVIDRQGLMSPESGPYAGKDRFEARQQIAAALEAQGLLEMVEPCMLTIGRCDRCKTITEPLVSTQWFVHTKPLAERALAAVESGRIRFVPDKWAGGCVRWLETAGDWCISRQLWWGHRIPAWHCQDCSEITVARSAPSTCPRCGRGSLEQDPDVVDTYFGCALWPFSTLGWPDETEEFKAYYPTSLLIAGFEILFFWVARMIMLGLELTGQDPFRVVHIHGLVRDADGYKMSKTKGNVVDPLDITNRFGTDAVRVSLTMGVVSGDDMIFSEDKLTAARTFVDKIWNAAQLLFMKMKTSAVQPPAVLEPGRVETLEDRWIFTQIQRTADAVNVAFENHRYDEVAETLRHFFCHDVCDVYMEIKRLRLRESTGLTNDWRNLLAVFSASLRMLHPLTPFITEELWHRLGGEGSISLQPYPAGFPMDEVAEYEMASRYAEFQP
jgi:valyl-tRNA synthetase